MKCISGPLLHWMANLSGGKTAIQTLREEFHPLEISELTGYANLKSISNYSHNHKQRRMSEKIGCLQCFHNYQHQPFGTHFKGAEGGGGEGGETRPGTEKRCSHNLQNDPLGRVLRKGGTIFHTNRVDN